MLTLHTIHNYPPVLKGNVRDLRAVWALEELGLPYGFRWLDFAALEHRGAANRTISPFGRIPALQDDGACLFESGAIVLYLYDKAGRLPATALERATLNQWCFAALNTVEPAFFEMALWAVRWRDKPGHEWYVPRLRELAQERLGDLERILGTRTCLAGETFGPADILMTTALDFCRADAALFEPFAAVRAYLQRHHARPAYAKAQSLQGAGPQADAA